MDARHLLTGTPGKLRPQGREAKGSDFGVFSGTELLNYLLIGSLPSVYSCALSTSATTYNRPYECCHNLTNTHLFNNKDDESLLSGIFFAQCSFYGFVKNVVLSGEMMFEHHSVDRIPEYGHNRGLHPRLPELIMSD